MKRLLGALAALALLAPAAAAQDSSLFGRWSFRTGPHPETQCVISGTADFSAGEARGSLNVTLTAHETCPSDNETVTAVESCTALSAETIEIFCVLQHATSPNYVPDNFFLRRVARGVLDGRLNDQNYWDVPVRFERDGDGALVS